MNKKKNTLIAVCIVAGFVIIGLALALIIRWQDAQVTKVDLNPSNTEEGEIHFDVETLTTDGTSLIISGWRVLPINERRSFGTYVVLYDGEDYYRLPTNYVERPDVTNIINDGNTYVRCGFYSSTLLSKLKGNTTYHVYLMCRPDTKKYQYFDFSEYYVIDTGKDIHLD